MHFFAGGEGGCDGLEVEPVSTVWAAAIDMPLYSANKFARQDFIARRVACFNESLPFPIMRAMGVVVERMAQANG